MSSSDDTPGIGFHPPLLHAAAFAAGWAIDRFVLAIRLPGGSAMATAGIALALVGIALALWGAWTMYRARTGIPVHHKVNALVTGGPFAFTRNPLYMAINLIYAGVACALLMLWPLLLMPLVLVALQLLVIDREERFLARRFPESYPAYRARVRRWL
jgi:protein-S-isoprenylcysteine O-methyltransferase Ste14